MQFIKANTHIDFIGKRKFAMAFSGLMIAISIGFLLVRGLNFGIDFTGGTLVEVQFKHAPNIADVREAIKPKGYSQAIIQTFGAPTEILIRVQNKKNEESSTISNHILDALKGSFGTKNPVEMRRVEFVGPQVGKELARDGILAVLIAMAAILVYVTFRFELRFALGADLALLHDVTIVLGVFAITGKEFNLPVVAAVLTVIGYSLNDTIVVFDRIRENIASSRKKKNPESEAVIVNDAINQTLSRTIMTSMTTLLVVIALFFLGGEVIHNFALALMTGIIVGTYSSIYIASPVMMALHGRFKGSSEEEIKELEAKP